MVCWYLCLATSLCPGISALAGCRCLHTFHQESRRHSPLEHLEDTHKRTLVFLRRD